MYARVKEASFRRNIPNSAKDPVFLLEIDDLPPLNYVVRAGVQVPSLGGGLVVQYGVQEEKQACLTPISLHPSL